jgi:hypothetical protein
MALAATRGGPHERGRWLRSREEGALAQRNGEADRDCKGSSGRSAGNSSEGGCSGRCPCAPGTGVERFPPLATHDHDYPRAMPSSER